ncbi:MAG: hypothetical protein J5654_09055 [Victivallales bacterium]|nr:hypothetical protein [Victivallales bacterium]
MSQLKMIFEAQHTPLPELTIAEGFRLRTIADSELERYNALRISVGFSPWDAERLLKFRSKVLPDSLFLVEETATGRFAASAAAETTDMPEFPEVGVLGWVMCHPDFAGCHLGRSVSVAAMHRLYEAGYRAFSLLTDDFRPAAVKTYLELGWKPWLYLEDMEGRWRALANQLNRDFDSLGCSEHFTFPMRIN